MAESYKKIDVDKKGAVHVWQASDNPEAIVVYIHGFFGKRSNGGTYPDYWKWSSGLKHSKVTLEAQARQSGMNIMFILFRAPESGGSPGNPKATPPKPAVAADPVKLYWPDLDALLEAAGAPADKPVVLMGHSGAYRTYLNWTTHPRVLHMTLLDSVYFGDTKKFAAWIKDPTHTIDVVECTTPGSTTLVAAMDKVDGVKVVLRTKLPTADQALTDEEKNARVLHYKAYYDHNGLIHDGKVIPFLLRRAPGASKAKLVDPPPVPPPEVKKDPPKIEPEKNGAGANGPEVFIPTDKLPRHKQGDMGDSSWTHCGYCCKILTAHYLHKLKGNDTKPKWFKGVDTNKLMQGTGYAFDGYAMAAEVSDTGSVLKKDTAPDALKMVDEYLSMSPPMPIVVGVDHKSGTANKGVDIDHFVLIVGRKYKNGKVTYPIHDVAGGTGDKFFEVKDGVLYKDGYDFRVEGNKGKVALRRYIATAIARYRADGAPPPSNGAVVVPAHSEPSGSEPSEIKPHEIENPLASSLREDKDLLRMAVARDIVLKKGAPQTEAVKLVQAALNKVQDAGLTVDGDYGKKSGLAVQSFQEACISNWKKIGSADKLTGFKADGLLGARSLLALDASLSEAEGTSVKHDGAGTAVDMPMACPGVPTASEEQAHVRYSTAIDKVGNFQTTAWEMNIVGIRGFKDGKRVEENMPESFDDTIAVVYKCDKGHKHAKEFLGSIDPSRSQDGEPDIHLADGQYIYTLGEREGAKVLKPKDKVTVWIDKSEDGVRHPDDPVEVGKHDIYVCPSKEADVVDDAGGGLQLIAGGADGAAWKSFLKLAERDPSGQFYYTLIDGADVPGQNPLETKPNAEKPPPKNDLPPGELPEPVKDTPPVLADPGEPAETEPAFAEPTGLYWPIVTKLKKGREVAFKKKSDGKFVGNAGRRFLASRSGGKRYHVGIDLWGALGDPVVACEDGKIVNWHHFYEGVWAIFVQNDSGTVINYGEVDKTSLTKMGLKIGSRVKAGQQIGIVGKMKVDSMCHFEMYVNGTTDNHRWYPDKKRPPELLNPTKYLLALATGKGPPAPVLDDTPDPSMEETFTGTLEGPAGPLKNWPFVLKRDGAAVDKPSLSPAKSANEFKNGFWCTTAEGKYNFEDLPQAEYTIEVLLPGGKLRVIEETPPPGASETGQRAAKPKANKDTPDFEGVTGSDFEPGAIK